mmetsp:Transcript_58216/g.92006  ORF Transcript_58216/g.92006 Transcript_58216/m.92006 type:complete len:90 (-) Transcript_58216:1723-1992(-)
MLVESDVFHRCHASYHFIADASVPKVEMQARYCRWKTEEEFLRAVVADLRATTEAELQIFDTRCLDCQYEVAHSIAADFPAVTSKEAEL